MNTTMICSDNHVHTSFSTDSHTPMESQLLQAKALGLPSLCFTDHIDYGYLSKNGETEFLFPMEDYFAAAKSLREKYPDFPFRTGVELGLKKDIPEQCLALTKQYPFDFVIGSTHLVDNIDPYYPEYWEKYGETAGIAHYYQTTLENILLDFDFDVYGHIDYIIRYCPTIRAAREKGSVEESCLNTFIRQNKEIIAEILQQLIARGKGIELNTGGFKYGLGHPNPHEDILSLYRDLGGEIISAGSDAHEEKHLAYDFSKVPSILTNCGFSYYTEFHGRKPVQIPLS